MKNIEVKPTVKLSIENDSAFSVMDKVLKALCKSGCTQTQLNQFREEATKGDYNHLIKTCCKWVNVV
jgi:hypothetical protein